MRFRVVRDGLSPGSHPGAGAFALCEIEWMRQRLLSELDCELLAEFAVNAREGAATFSESELRHVASEVDALEEQVVSIAFGLSSIPMRDVEATPDDIASGAANALADGIADVERALHAARWIPPADGLRALAQSLRDNDSHHFWDVPPEQFISAFRDIDPRLGGAIARQAHVGDERFSELGDAEVAALADVLDSAAESFS